MKEEEMKKVADFFRRLDAMEVSPYAEGFKVTLGGRVVGVVGAEERTRCWNDRPYESQEITLEGWDEEQGKDLRLIIVPGVGYGDDVSFSLVGPGGEEVDHLVVYAVPDESRPTGAGVRVR